MGHKDGESDSGRSTAVAERAPGQGRGKPLSTAASCWLYILSVGSNRRVAGLILRVAPLFSCTKRKRGKS